MSVPAKTYKCLYCEFLGVEDELWAHIPKIHGHLPNRSDTCPICNQLAKAIAVHLHDDHGPPSRISRPEGWNENLPTPTYAVVICRHPDGKFLLVEEPASWGWWMPAGRVDPGETMGEGAIREALEEAGVDVILKGLLKLEYLPNPIGGGRQRAIFYAEPKDPNQLPKSEPDYESRRAKWTSFEEIETLYKNGELRGMEPYIWAKHLRNGGAHAS